MSGMYLEGQLSHLSEHSWNHCRVPAVRGCRINNQIINIISVVRKTMLVKGQKCSLPW